MGFSLGSVAANVSELKEVWGNLKSPDWNGLAAAAQEIRQKKGNTGTLERIESCAKDAESNDKDFPTHFNGLVRLVG